MIKIFELKGDDWMKGMSLQTPSAIGGLFSATTNFDPFDISGMMQCSLASAKASDLDITTSPTVITPTSISGSPKVFVHSPTKLYQVLDGTPWTTTDKTASVVTTNGVRGAIIWRQRYVYSLDTSVRSTALDLSGDAQLLASANSNGIWHPFCVGADLNLYMGDFRGVSKFILATGTTGNTINAFGLEAGMYVRDLLNDGRYLVILADNNPTGDYNNAGASPTVPVPIAGKYRCQVQFWDMVKGTADQIFEFTDSYLVGGKILDGGIYVFGGDNIYVCNVATPPKAIFNFRGNSSITEKPQTPFQIVQANNSIYWTGQSNGKVYAYGSLFPGMKKVFYQPFNSSYTPTAINFNGSNFYVGTSGTDNFLRVTHTGTTRNTGSVTTAPIVLDRPYTFGFAKIVMQQPLASGDSVDLYMATQAGTKQITSSNSKAYSAIGAKQTVIFNRTPAGSGLDVDRFEDFQLTVSSNKAIARVEIWASPQDPHTQTT